MTRDEIITSVLDHNRVKTVARTPVNAVKATTDTVVLIAELDPLLPPLPPGPVAVVGGAVATPSTPPVTAPVSVSVGSLIPILNAAALKLA